MKSYTERISNSQVMQSGMNNNATEASGRGWSLEKNAQLEVLRSEATVLNDEQERLKAHLKMKTAELDAKMLELDTMMSEAKKVVKLSFPQSQWKEFGVTDKR